MREWRMLLILPVIHGLCASAGGAPSAVPPRSEDLGAKSVAWRQNYYCGVNCIYVMLKMVGKNTSYETLCDETSVGVQGSSMAELGRLAKIHGIELTPVKA